MSSKEAGNGLASIDEFQVQIKGHNQREYEGKWQGWQNSTDEKLATRPTMPSNRSCYYQPGGSLTRRRNLKVKCDGKGHERE